MKRSRSFLDLINEKIEQEPSTNPDTVSLYLKFIVALDFLAVATVVPLLPQYLARTGCCNEQLAFISSAYSLAQLVGGVLLGWVSDGIMTRKTILMTSLLGSAASYGMVGVSSSRPLLILSRIVVGLVKQTMTMTTALISDLPLDRSRRTKHMSHLTAAVTVSWIVGPALGGYLFWLSPCLPPLVAAVIFTVAALLCLIGVPNHPDPRPAGFSPLSTSISSPDLLGMSNSSSNGSGFKPKSKSLRAFLSTLRNNFREAFNDPTIIRIVGIRLLYSFTIISLMPTNFVGYLEARYGLKSHEVAYLHSYRATLSFLAQTFLVSAVVRHHAFSEEATARAAIVFGVFLKYSEVLNRDRLVFLFVTTPAIVGVFSLFDCSLQGIYTDSIPAGHRGAALGSMSALQSLIKIAAPLYGGEIFQRVGHERRPEIIFFHYVVLATVVWLVFPPGRHRPKQQQQRLPPSVSTGSLSQIVEGKEEGSGGHGKEDSRSRESSSSSSSSSRESSSISTGLVRRNVSAPPLYTNLSSASLSDAVPIMRPAPVSTAAAAAATAADDAATAAPSAATASRSGSSREPVAIRRGGMTSLPSSERLHPIRGRFDRGSRVRIGQI
jgi:DHA1 family multidrug resistance protein-like MFS transporter